MCDQQMKQLNAEFEFNSVIIVSNEGLNTSTLWTRDLNIVSIKLVI